MKRPRLPQTLFWDAKSRIIVIQDILFRLKLTYKIINLLLTRLWNINPSISCIWGVMLAVTFWDVVVSGVVLSALSDSTYTYCSNINYEHTVYHWRYWNRPCSEHVVSPDVLVFEIIFKALSRILFDIRCMQNERVQIGIETKFYTCYNRVIYTYDNMWRHTTFCMWESFSVGTNVKRQAYESDVVTPTLASRFFFPMDRAEWRKLLQRRSVIKTTVINVRWLNQGERNGWGI
jgi:hypothetical protein